MHRLGARVNLVICQKSKINDWVEHFKTYYWDDTNICDLTTWKSNKFSEMLKTACECKCWNKTILVINYELAFRRPELADLTDFTLMLDESSLIQNEQAKRTKFIMKKLKPANVILLSGTPTSGKYERLWSQLWLLGWKIKKQTFWNHYVDYHYTDMDGFPFLVIDGYKNIERLKSRMADCGCVFMKTDEVFELPDQVFEDVKIKTTPEYKKFKKNSIVEIGSDELVGDCTLTKMLYERMLCGHYNGDKIAALRDLLESTSDRVIVFYNFDAEMRAIEDVCIALNKPTSFVNGHQRDLSMYDAENDTVIIVQYQAGAMGLNLQKANKIVYFTPPLSCEFYMQSKKRTHRIGQKQTCFYYRLICENSVETKIYKALERGVNYTDKLFEKDV